MEIQMKARYKLKGGLIGVPLNIEVVNRTYFIRGYIRDEVSNCVAIHHWTFEGLSILKPSLDLVEKIA